MKNLKNYLKEKVEKMYEEGKNFYDLSYKLFGGHLVKGWPWVFPEDSEEEDKEPLDMENFEWLSIDEDKLEICCGGDWQKPMKLTLQLDDGDKLVVIDTENDYFENGLSEDKFNDLLGIYHTE